MFAIALQPDKLSVISHMPICIPMFSNIADTTISATVVTSFILVPWPRRLGKTTVEVHTRMGGAQKRAKNKND